MGSSMTKVVMLSQSRGLVRLHAILNVAGSDEAYLARACRTSLRTGNRAQADQLGPFTVRGIDAESVAGRVVVEIEPQPVGGRAA